MALLQISQELQAHTLALDELIAEALHAQQGLPGAHCTVAADFQRLTRELVRCAVIADREAGATWATIGEALGLSADAARARYGKVRLLWPHPQSPPDRHRCPPQPPERPAPAGRENKSTAQRPATPTNAPTHPPQPPPARGPGR
ncbi:hypothetical protein ACIRST_21910 [Kitasatospora sp. NPDC101447]|uniref:hypothetical protein n=1 Tax=Kitasatospora sp. NPDC101447 TaxID=3364102 RepID=UPI00382D2C90